MIPSCKELTELVSQGEDRPLRWSERLRVRLHLLICEGCRQFTRHITFMRGAMQRFRERD
jgi:hypothetical protein